MMDALTGWIDPTYAWLVLGIVLFVVELLNPGVILIFFSMGAFLVAVLCRAVELPVIAQVLTFALSSVAFLMALRKWFKNVFAGRVAKDGACSDDDGVLGATAIVTEGVRPHFGGRVELRGTQWGAEADAEIPAGTPVLVIGKRSITLIVKPIERG